MADEVDRGNDQAEQTLQHLVAQARRVRALMPVGRCYNCEEHVEINRLFCDLDCREDYDRRQRRK